MLRHDEVLRQHEKHFWFVALLRRMIFMFLLWIPFIEIYMSFRCHREIFKLIQRETLVPGEIVNPDDSQKRKKKTNLNLHFAVICGLENINEILTNATSSRFLHTKQRTNSAVNLLRALIVYLTSRARVASHFQSSPSDAWAPRPGGKSSMINKSRLNGF